MIGNGKFGITRIGFYTECDICGTIPIQTRSNNTTPKRNERNNKMLLTSAQNEWTDE